MEAEEYKSFSFSYKPARFSVLLHKAYDRKAVKEYQNGKAYKTIDLYGC